MKKSKHNKERILTVLLVVTLGAFLGGAILRRCSQKDESRIVSEYVRPSGDTLSVAIEMSPLSYTLSRDTAAGFDYEMLRQIGAQQGIEMVFYPFSQLDKALEELENGTFDIVAASLPATSELKSRYRLTDPVYLDKQVLVQRRAGSDSLPPITSQEQLLGDTVWIAGGKPFTTRLRNMSHELGDTVYFITDPVHSSEHLAIMTALGEIKQAVVNEEIARRIAAQYPVLDISTPISFNQFQVWAVAPCDSVLADSLSSWVEQFKLTPAYTTLKNKYLNR